MTESDIKEHLRVLHAAREALIEDQLRLRGEVMVLASAVVAMVDTHPEPANFAEALRRAWFRLGQPHAGGETYPALLAGIDQMLTVLEEASQVPLNLRPPRDS